MGRRVYPAAPFHINDGLIRAGNGQDEIYVSVNN